MKKWIMLGWLLAVGMAANAQYAQILENIAQQVALFQEYISEAEKGYKIVEDGLHTIRDIKNGEFNLHSTFFGSLKAINPQVAGLAEVGEIIAFQATLAQQVAKAMEEARSMRWLLPAERDYAGKFYQVLLNACNAEVYALGELVTADKLTMTDGERIRSIGSLRERVGEEYGALRVFRDRVELLEMQREREAATIGVP
ncbi:MAG: hypothetical protein Q8927_19280 [Bacteroidota bacterium]|nr:hypothetical protein [Bacteroidota bacterium]MDP4247379.1 hypothetical protein [Bacteroidota bacterium]MDP4256401.1 hypothetical protein [Bacteroidota bacterium]MDP4260042.1 hypothetical protein [Bacteroidota bacterium]